MFVASTFFFFVCFVGKKNGFLGMLYAFKKAGSGSNPFVKEVKSIKVKNKILLGFFLFCQWGFVKNSIVGDFF